MRKFPKKFQISVAVLLIVAIGSFAIPVLAESNVVSKAVSKVEDTLHANSDSIEIKREEVNPQTITQTITTSSETNDPMAAIKAKSKENRKHRLRQQDEFNYSQKDVEELLMNGATLEDIYRSDEIGNQVLVNPRDLIDKKRQGKQSWDNIESDETTKVDQQLKSLKKKHADLESKLAKQTMSSAEQIEIIEHLESSPEDTVDEAIEAYNQKGRDGLKSLHDKKSNTKGGK